MPTSTPKLEFSPERDRALLSQLTAALAPDVGPDCVRTLSRYVALVVTWNRKLDLTAARQARAQLEVLLSDALALADPTRVPIGSRCLDVGSGNGAPTLPLLLLRADLSALLIEPLRKRVAFLRSAIGTLGLAARARVVERKLDPARPDVEGAPFDVALSRATFAPEVWLPAATSLAERSIVLLADRPPPAAPEAAELSLTFDYTLPFSGAPRRIAVYSRRHA